MAQSHKLAQVARRVIPLGKWGQRHQATAPENAPLAPENDDAMRVYRDLFTKSAQAFRQFVAQCQMPAASANGNPVGIVICPWVGTPVPWYSLALGIGLACLGREVTLIWDDTIFPVASPFLDLQNDWIGQVLELLKRHFNVIHLAGEEPGAPKVNDALAVRHLLDLNVAWALRSGTPDQEALRVAEVTYDHMSQSLAQIRGLLNRQKFRYLVIPGGIYGTSGLFQLAAHEANLRAATFDSGLGWVVVCRDGVAAYQGDIPDAFEAIYDQPSEDMEDLIRAAREELNQRTKGIDRLGYQSIGPVLDTAIPANSVLIPLSIDWDSAALGRHHIFASTAEWLLDTVGFVLEHSDARVVVRQHPSERRGGERSRGDLETLLAERYGRVDRYHFIRAEQPVNTYSLLESARLVLPYVSTIGIEAAALGKPVLLAGAAYYGPLGFAHTATTRLGYFELLQQALNGTLPVLTDQTRRAWVCFYLNAVCYRVFTEFGPQQPDFWKWCQMSPDRLYADPAVNDLLTALDDNIPVALVRHRRRQMALAQL